MEFLLIMLIVFWVAPVVLVLLVANSRGRSGHYVWWPIFLGWLGGIIAAAVILVQAEKPPDRLGSYPQSGDVRGNRRPAPTKSPRAVAAARRSHHKGLHERRPDNICPLCRSTEDVPAIAPRDVQSEGETERRLREIDRLRQAGLITEDEHQTHRSRVLDDVLGLSAREGRVESGPYIQDATTTGFSLAEAAESWQVHRAHCGACNAAAPGCDTGHRLYSAWAQLRDADARP